MIEWFAWIVIVGIAIALYLVIYKYEKKLEVMEELIKSNKDNIDQHHSKIKDNHERINLNHERLDKHNNHIEKMWVTIPKQKED